MNVRRVIGVVVLIGLATGIGLAQGHGVMQSPAEAKWGPAPPMLPPGAQIADRLGRSRQGRAVHRPAQVSGELRHPGAFPSNG